MLRGRGITTTRQNSGEEERDQLIPNEHTETLDDEFAISANVNAGGFVADDDDDDDSVSGGVRHFVPAAQRYNDDEDIGEDYYANVDLQSHQVLITEAPKDYYNYTYIVFYLLGIGTMTPWNFFVTAEDYWNYKFRNTTLNDTNALIEEDLTPLQKSFTCDLTLTASISGTTFLILNAIYGHHVSLRVKILGTLLIILAMFGVTTAFIEINTDKWQEQFFLITLFTVVIMNIAAATMSGGIFGVAGLFPSEYMTAIVSGQALGGIVSAVAFILVLTLDVTPKMTALVYFSLGIVLMFSCIVCYMAMVHRPFFKYYLDGGDRYKIICETPMHSRTEDTGVALDPILSEVMSKIYVEVIAICLLYTTTLSVYPGVTVLMRSVNAGNGKPWNDIYFVPVVNYLIFNCGDYFGRLLAGWMERFHSNSHTVLMSMLLRNLYVPFLLCANSDVHYFLPVLLRSDFAFISAMATFAISNGYLTNILLIMAPRAVKQHEREMASSIMVASLSCGLAIGSLLSMVFVQLL